MAMAITDKKIRKPYIINANSLADGSALAMRHSGIENLDPLTEDL